MKSTYFFLLALLSILACAGPDKVSSSNTVPSLNGATSVPQTQILLLGSVHFSQLHDQSSATSNFLSKKRQQEIDEVNNLLAIYRPDMIMIEREPAEQPKYDSLYQQYIAGKIDLSTLDGATGEVYQFAFKLGKELQLAKLYCVDYYNSTSQSLLTSGDHHEIFQSGLRSFQETTRGVTADFKNGNMSVREFLVFLNKPEIVELSHQQFYNLPAYVQNGSFRNYEGLNKSEIDTTQIGAEFISLFYERNLKIYSNILNSQLRNNGQRILLIMGQTHIGVLQDILKNNPRYEIVDANKYLDTTI